MIDPPPGDEDQPGQFTDDQLDHVEIVNDRMYRHKVLRVNYTTYDIRRDQDVIKPGGHCNIMLLAGDSDDEGDPLHPYWYAQVLDIFHVVVRYDGPGSTRLTRKGVRMDLLWVRWYTRDQTHSDGIQERSLPRLSFVDANDQDAHPFGFVDPDDVVRGAYILPGFHDGLTDQLLGHSPLARREWEDHDYVYYYTCM